MLKQITPIIEEPLDEVEKQLLEKDGAYTIHPLEGKYYFSININGHLYQGEIEEDEHIKNLFNK